MPNEDLFTNPFFVTLRKKFGKLYKEAEDFCYMICIPQKKMVRNRKITREDIETHIIFPSHDTKGEYLTKNNKVVTVVGKTIKTKRGFREDRSVNILFEELSYNENDQQFRIICLENLLEGGKSGQDGDGDGDEPELPPNYGYVESKKYLESFPENIIVLRKIDQLTKNFCMTYVMVKGAETHIQERVTKIVEQATEFLGCANQHLRDLYNTNHDDMQQMVESFVLHGIHNKLFSSLKYFFSVEDATTYKTLQSMKNITQQSYGVPDEYCFPQEHAIELMKSLDNCRCPIDMLLILNDVKNSITKEIEINLRENDKTDCLSADELFPITIYVIVQSQLKNLCTYSFYIEHYTFVDVSISELGYNLVSFQAAVEYINTNDFLTFEGFNPEGVILNIQRNPFAAIPIDPVLAPNHDLRKLSSSANLQSRSLKEAFPQIRIPQPPPILRSNSQSFHKPL